MQGGDAYFSSLQSGLSVLFFFARCVFAKNLKNRFCRKAMAISTAVKTQTAGTGVLAQIDMG